MHVNTISGIVSGIIGKLIGRTVSIKEVECNVQDTSSFCWEKIRKFLLNLGFSAIIIRPIEHILDLRFSMTYISDKKKFEYEVIALLVACGIYDMRGHPTLYALLTALCYKSKDSPSAIEVHQLIARANGQSLYFGLKRRKCNMVKEKRGIRSLEYFTELVGLIRQGPTEGGDDKAIDTLRRVSLYTLNTSIKKFAESLQPPVEPDMELCLKTIVNNIMYIPNSWARHWSLAITYYAMKMPSYITFEDVENFVQVRNNSGALESLEIGKLHDALENESTN